MNNNNNNGGSICIEETMELGAAIQSLSSVISAKEDYVMESDDDISSHDQSISSTAEAENNDSERDDVLLLGDTSHDISEVQLALDSHDMSESLLLNMFLPQERQAMVEIRRRARQRQENERWARYAHVSMVISAVVISLLLILCLVKIFADRHYHEGR